MLLLSLPHRPAEIRIAIGVQLGACAAGVLVATASGRVVAATCEAPHVPQCPYYRTAELLQCLDGKKTCTYPMQVNNVRGVPARQPVEPAGKPADSPKTIICRRVFVKRQSVEFDPQS